MKKGFSTPALIITIVAVLIVLAGAGVGLWYWARSRVQEEARESVEEAEETTRNLEESTKSFTELPSDFPQILVYPESEIILVMDHRPDKSNVNVNFEHADSVSKIYDYFDKALRDDGWELDSVILTPDEYAAFEAIKDNYWTKIYIQKQEEATGIDVNLTIETAE